jgi:glutathione S-transferase
MKLYYHPVSTTSRPLVLFAAENKVALDLQVVDLMTGEHYKPEYEAINPNHLVPLLEDGKFRLSESSAILKYLADKVDSPLYPKDLQARARINERMDWINTQLNRELCYGVVYPQVFAHHKRPSEETQSATLQWGKERAQGWLKILDETILGKDNKFLCGDTMTIADYFGAGFVSAGEIVGCDYAAYPNVQRWLARMKALKSWKQVHEIFDGWTASLKGKPMVTA